MASKSQMMKIKKQKKKAKRRAKRAAEAAIRRVYTNNQEIKKNVMKTLGDSTVAVKQVLMMCQIMLEKLAKVNEHADTKIAEGIDVEKYTEVKKNVAEESERINKFITEEVSVLTNELKNIADMSESLEQASGLMDIQMKIMDIYNKIPGANSLSLLREIEPVANEEENTEMNSNSEMTINVNDLPSDLPEVKEFKKIEEKVPLEEIKNPLD